MKKTSRRQAILSTIFLTKCWYMVYTRDLQVINLHHKTWGRQLMSGDGC